MFKSWKRDKKKIKLVFQLQFQATQVPKLKKSGVTISLVPDDVGKATIKLEKVAAQDGICLWENPIYETIKLIRDLKTGQISEKIYHFVVSNGSSKSGFLGEASIDFADFASESEPITVSLPLKFANSGAILHVTVHRMLGDADQRDLEEFGDLALSREGSLQNQEIRYSIDGNELNFAEDGNMNMAIYQNGDGNGSMRKTNLHKRSNTDWSLGSASEGSLNESSNSNDTPKEWRDAAPNDSIEKLKSENAKLARQAELSDLEVQAIRKQVARENRRVQDLSRQVVSLREEKDAVKSEFEQFKSKAENEEAGVSLEEIRQELDHEKELSANLRLQLQKTQDSNSNLILAVRDLNEMLEQKNEEIYRLSRKIETDEAEHQKTMTELVKVQSDADEIDTLNKLVDELSAELEHYKKDKKELEMHIDELSQDYEVLKQENNTISSKLEQNQLEESIRVENELSESLATIKELQSQVQILEDRIKQQSEEYSESLIAINELESEVKELRKEMEKREQGFQDDMDDMIRSKTEQEQRAIRAEEALRNSRWKNAVTAERLQEELKRLSVEMSSKVDDNEKKYMVAIKEANELRVDKISLEEMLEQANEDLGLVKDMSLKREQELLNELEQVQKKEGENKEASTKEIQTLKAEIEKLSRERKQYSDIEDTKATTNGETAKLIKKWKKERDDLEKKITSAKTVADKAEEQLLTMRSLKDEKETSISNLQSEMQSLRVEYNGIKRSLIKEEKEKEKLQKEVLQLRNNLETSTKSNTSTSPPHYSKDITSLNKQMRLLKQQLKIKENTKSVSGKDESISNMIEELQSSMEQLKIHSQKGAISAVNNSEMLKEVAFLKERNKLMDHDLKDMQERYSELSLKFAMVEGERQELVMAVRNLKNGKR